jgi:hypothetical protein
MSKASSTPLALHTTWAVRTLPLCEGIQHETVGGFAFFIERDVVLEQTSAVDLNVYVV